MPRNWREVTEKDRNRQETVNQAKMLAGWSAREHLGSGLARQEDQGTVQNEVHQTHGGHARAAGLARENDPKLGHAIPVWDQPP